MGDLDKIWLDLPEEPGTFEEAFRVFFGAECGEVLDAAETSFSYNVHNNAYVSVRNPCPVVGLTLEELLEGRGLRRPPNIIAS